jgi:hypothetical protein
LKVIFSRKGIDSAYGKGVSPIFPNGDMLSIPIPAKQKENGIHYSRISFNGHSLQSYKRQLGLVTEVNKCHYDPCINTNIKVEGKSWCPSFGTHGAAASHLLNEEVSVGDLFLFFGTFRKVRHNSDRTWSFEKEFKAVHVLFGYLKVKQILYLKHDKKRDIAREKGLCKHPHIQNEYPINNVLFIGESEYSGSFKFHDELILSNDSNKKSVWRVPHFFADCKISRHSNTNRFQKNNDHLLWSTVSIGQEFVCKENVDVSGWAKSLIERHCAK